jgi:ribose 5-phosphate isomerase B
MKIALGCDHGGYELKEKILAFLKDMNHQVEDLGTHGPESVDYPQYAAKVARAVTSGEVERGILICGSGIGMSITANRFPGIRAALVSEPFSAKMSRRHNDSNILCLGGRFIGQDLAAEIVKVWLDEPFDGGRHERRIELIDKVIDRED